MYKSFSDRARKVMVLASQEAQRFNHEYIGTEHILLGLVKESGGLAAHVLKSVDLDLITIRLAVERLVQRGPDMVTMGRLPQTPRAKKAIEYAIEESRKLGHNYIGTEHILLGLLREEEGVAAQVLLNLGLRLDAVCDEVFALLASGHFAPEPIGVSRFHKLIQRLFSKSKNHSFAQPPRIANQSGAVASLVAVDIGNSRMKLGQFLRDSTPPKVHPPLPEPSTTIELPITHKMGLFDLKQLATWCEQHLSSDTHWMVGTVHRGAGELLATTITAWAEQLRINWRIQLMTYRDVPLTIRVEQPERVGIDRLLAAVAANRLRRLDRAAIIVDLGTAVTVDLLEADGSFAGGAILPGIGMSARALAEQTDALPHVAMEQLEKPPSPLGKSTETAIQAGLYWGVVGAIRELVSQLAAGLPQLPELFVTGGASQHVAESLSQHGDVRHVPHLVLAGIALVDAETPGKEV